MNASSVLGNTRAAPKTAEEAAENERVCQKRGKIQSAWQDVISQGNVTPKRFEKQAVQMPKAKVGMPALFWGTHVERKKQQMKLQRSRT